MRKLSLLLIAIVLSFASYSQTFYKVLKSSYMVYENNAWVKKLSRDNTIDNLYAIVDEEKIKFTNESETSFVTYGDAARDTYANHKTSTWSAFDKYGEKCYIMIKYPIIPNGEMSIIIAYIGDEGKSFEYVVQTKN